MSTTEAARLLRQRAESYSSDARKFRDGIPGVSAGDGALYALTYRIVADELRKVAAELPVREPEPGPDAVARYLAHHGTPTTVQAGA